jgi:ketosteroid isomerase-like protein
VSDSKQMNVLKRAWDALAAGDLDRLASYYANQMIFVLPGQNDVIEGRAAFRAALDGIGQALPPGFKITDLRYCVGENEIVNVVEWTADKVPGGSQSAILWKFDDADRIVEERWYVDTEQWKAAF